MLEVDAGSAYPVLTAGARVRVVAYIPFLRAHGVDLRFSSYVGCDEYRLMSGGGRHLAKVAVTARCAARVSRRAQRPGSLLMVHRLLSLVPVPGRDPPPVVNVYDFDDALFDESGAAGNGRWHRLKRERRRCLEHLRRATLVLAGNEYLASHASRYAKRVEILPSCVDPSVQRLRRHRDVDVPTVGWVGSATTAPYLRELLPVFRALNRDRVTIRLLTVGAGRLPHEPWLEQRRWELESETDLLASLDIGVMPLPDDPWTRGKCGYKLLRYYAAGVPVVASPVGVNRRLLELGGGLAASSAEQWRSALCELASDPLARRQSGLAGRRLVESDFSYQRWAPELSTMLRSV
ncbi:MAG: glycosyltransferase family 4 protein [Solirubrobacteraceae bacterium]